MVVFAFCADPNVNRHKQSFADVVKLKMISHHRADMKVMSLSIAKRIADERRR